jgi:hypothetical protein
MRKLAVVVASALLGGLVGAPSAMAGDDEDFTLTGRFTEFDREDNGDRGWSEGDEVDFAFDLFDGRDDAGDGDGTCVITKLDRDDREFAADCDVTFDLEDGDTLDMEGEVTDDDFREGEVVLDVVGGSGDYDDASGKATFSGDRHGRRGGHSHGHRMSTASADTWEPAHAGGWRHGSDRRHGDKDGRKHRGGHGHDGGRHFKVDVDLD